MKYFLTSIILIGLFSVSFASHAKSPKPRCEMKKIAKMKKGHWRCVEPDITIGQPPHRNLPAGPRPKCKKGTLPKVVNGAWRCAKPVIASNHPSPRNNPVGKPPKCKMGMLPKVVNGHWRCMKTKLKYNKR